jgi:hypothetical protein
MTTTAAAERSRRYRERKRAGVVGLARVALTQADVDRLDRFGLLPKLGERPAWTDAEMADAIHAALRRLDGLETAMRALREADQPPAPKLRPYRWRL